MKTIKQKKVIALVAHDNRKKDMIEWVSYNWRELILHNLICTGTTGKLIQETLSVKCHDNELIPPEVIRL